MSSGRRSARVLALVAAATVEGSAATDVDVKVNDIELGVTLNGPGTFDLACGFDAGQDPSLATVPVTT
ncbi:hypothetical protein [Amycolatopsis minnesotensis]|uniref:Uncharacterized protein n=1 Tax=Amycolatopsis minnesotensis TaxID=337894 RepID=A0ABP5DQT7_9PSEU